MLINSNVDLNEALFVFTDDADHHERPYFASGLVLLGV